MVGDWRPVVPGGGRRALRPVTPGQVGPTGGRWAGGGADRGGGGGLPHCQHLCWPGIL